MGRVRMMDAGTAHDPRSRYVAVAVVIALHLLLLHIAQRMSGIAHRVQNQVEDALILLRLDRPADPTRVEEPRPARQADVEERAPGASSIIVAPQPQPIQSPTAPLPPRQIDWRADAARAARVVVEAAGREGYRSFGPRKQSKVGESQSPPASRDPPKHKLGDTDEVGGDPIVWLGNNCYMELEKRVPTAREWVAAGPGQFTPPPQIRCSGGGRSATAGGNLEDSRKREEPPVPKAGTEMNELPERIEEPQR